MEDGDEWFSEIWKSQWDSTKYTCARIRDHMITPFECNLCIFVKLQHRYPIISYDKDRKLCACIRRMNLDVFWSRSSTTIGNNRSQIKKAIKLSKEVGLKGPFKLYSSMPEIDHCEYELAIEMLLASTKPGRYSPKYT